MRARVLAALTAVAAVVPSGCLTKEMWEGYLDSGGSRVVSRRTVPGWGPVELIRAVRTRDGVYHVETRYGDGSRRHHVFDPAARVEGRSEPWPAAGRVPEGAACEEVRVFPASDAPLPEGRAVAIAVVGAPPPVDPGPPPGPLDLREPGVPLRAQLALDEGCLALREGQEEFVVVGRFPRDPDREVVDRTGLGAAHYALGAGVVLATPVTFALDTAFWGGVIAVIVGLPAAASCL